ncbi:MAG: VWA domain-containing protein [Candidatus Poribacteria bacterium]|nr:VWA domain-containing protein [Candidatus Poribacteria bacterium]
MNFLSPTALFLFGIAAPIVALYILKLRRRREPVSTLMFWEQIFKERQTTSLFQKLKHLLSLLLQLLFLTLLVLAIARPQFGFMTKLARQMVLIIDHSASMNTRGDTQTRLESAKERALQLVDNLRYIDEMMVISCHTQPIIQSPFTNHQKSLRAAIEAIQPTDVKTDLAPALSLAYSVTQTNTNPEIVVFSDFAIGATHQGEQVADMLQNPPPHVKLHLMPVADTVSENVGITQFRVRKSLVNAFDYQTLLTVANNSEAEKSFNVELYLNDALLDVRPYTLAAGEDKSEIFSNFTFEGGRLKAAIDVDDALATDNVAYAALPKREQIPVLLVTRGNTFLENALAVDEKLDVTVVAPDQYKPVSEGVTIFDRYSPPELGDGNYMFIYPPEDGAMWEIGEPLESPIVTDWARGHPILRYVQLDNVLIGEAYQVTPPPHAKVLVRSFDDPLLIVDSTANRKIVFAAIDILKSDLPLRIAFPVIIANTIQWFSSGSGIEDFHLQTGEILSKQVPSTVEGATITTPAGGQTEVAVEDGQLLFDQTSVSGFYELKVGADEEVWAVNLTDESESQIGVTPSIEDLLDEEMVGLGGSALLRYPPWIYLIFLAVALSAVEWWLYQRRRID